MIDAFCYLIIGGDLSTALADALYSSSTCNYFCFIEYDRNDIVSIVLSDAALSRKMLYSGLPISSRSLFIIQN